ncbi:MAG: hypothetical protein GY711_22265 [bacterium]|nr:hypothetical protein [bacterium]
MWPGEYLASIVGEYGRDFEPNWMPVQVQWGGSRPPDYERAWHQAGAFQEVSRAFEQPCFAPGVPVRRSRGELSVPQFEYGPTHELLDMEAGSHAIRRAFALARVALALRAEEQRSGATPTTLHELAPRFGGTVPSDPCTGNPFVYEEAAAGKWRLGLPPVPRVDPVHASGSSGWVHEWIL